MLRTKALALAICLVSTSALAQTGMLYEPGGPLAGKSPAEAAAAAPVLTDQRPAAPAALSLSYEDMMQTYIGANKDTFLSQPQLIESYGKRFSCPAWMKGGTNEFEKPALVEQAKRDLSALPGVTDKIYTITNANQRFGEYDAAKGMFPFGDADEDMYMTLNDPRSGVFYATQACTPDALFPRSVILFLTNSAALNGIPMSLEDAKAFMAGRANIPEWNRRNVDVILTLKLTGSNKWNGTNKAELKAEIIGAELKDLGNNRIIYTYPPEYFAKRNSEIKAEQDEKERVRLTSPVPLTPDNLEDWRTALEKKDVDNGTFRDGSKLRNIAIEESTGIMETVDEKTKKSGISLNVGEDKNYSGPDSMGKKITLHLMNAGEFGKKTFELSDADKPKFEKYGTYKQTFIVKPTDLEKNEDGDTIHGFIEKVTIEPLYSKNDPATGQPIDPKKLAFDLLPTTKASDYKLGYGESSETNPNDPRDAGQFTVLGLDAKATPKDVIEMANEKFGQELSFDPEELRVRSPESQCMHQAEGKLAGFYEQAQGTACIDAQFIKTGKKWFGLGGAKYALTRLTVVRQVDLEKGSAFDKGQHEKYGKPASLTQIGASAAVVSFGESMSKNRAGLVQTGQPMRPYEYVVYVQPIRGFVQIGEYLTTKLYMPAKNGDLDTIGAPKGKVNYFGG